MERTKEYIRNGDIFQAVISRQFRSPMKQSLMNAYRVLRTTNPSPYMVYLHTEEEELMSTSPETLVRLNKGRLVTFPVAGSRPRGRTEEEDRALTEELLQDEKELSEHNMLVDLGRNDLGKISRFGSVAVTGYQMIHKYSRIMHICSQVEGDIREDRDALDAIEAVLPAGTLSGAPKIRACQIIEELEQEARGIYGGALGYIDFTGNMDTCIAIRMAVRKNDMVYVQAGGGIVADSVPETEYQESGNKAAAVLQAIMRAGEAEGGGQVSFPCGKKRDRAGNTPYHGLVPGRGGHGGAAQNISGIWAAVPSGICFDRIRDTDFKKLFKYHNRKGREEHDQGSNL